MDPEPFKVGDVVWVCADSIEAEQYQDPTRLVSPPEPRRIKITEIDKRGASTARGYGYYGSDELDADSNNAYRVYAHKMFRTCREAYEDHVASISNYLEELAQEVGTWTDTLNRLRKELRDDPMEE